jgi:hypothetical protein
VQRAGLSRESRPSPLDYMEHLSPLRLQFLRQRPLKLLFHSAMRSAISEIFLFIGSSTLFHNYRHQEQSWSL